MGKTFVPCHIIGFNDPAEMVSVSISTESEIVREIIKLDTTIEQIARMIYPSKRRFYSDHQIFLDGVPLRKKDMVKTLRNLGITTGMRPCIGFPLMKYNV